MAQLPIQQAFQLALQHHQAGRLREAEQLYREVLAQQADHAGALHYLGLIAGMAGRSDVAVDLLRRAIAARPNYPEAQINLGNALKDNGQLDEAIAAYRQAIALRPGFAEAHSNLGNALKAKGQLDAAIAAFAQAIALKPGFLEAHYNLGAALQARGQLDEAIAAYRRALAINPGLAEAHNNLGNALKDTGQLDAAMAAFRQAIALKPDYAQAWNNLGVAMGAGSGNLDQAVAAFGRAIALKPDYADAYSNLGSALRAKGDLDGAIAAYRQAVALAPDDAGIDSNLVYTLHFHPAYDAATIAHEHRRWNQQHAEPLRRLIQPHANERSPERRLRIGYVSPDFREHAQSFFTVPLLSSHNHQNFEIVCYSGVLRPDALTDRLRGYADTWHNTVGRTDEELAAQIRRDKVDILVDLTMHMARNRLGVFARKPAPIQVCWLAYPGSTGLATMDYRLSDPYLDPPGMDESIYSEQTIRLPDSFWCYDPLDGREIAANPLPALGNGVVTFGCFSSVYKLNDTILALWAQVLRKVENSRLLLLAPEGDHRQRMADRLGQEGIEAKRVEFVSPRPRREYLELYHRIDLGLDSFPYNGHTTSLDSLWMGVPVVTLVGQTAVSRAGWCQLSSLGLQDLAGQTPKQFVQIAAGLANDLPRLQQLRSTLRQRMAASPLMDAPKFARGIEAAYREMWRKWCATV